MKQISYNNFCTMFLILILTNVVFAQTPEQWKDAIGPVGTFEKANWQSTSPAWTLTNESFQGQSRFVAKSGTIGSDGTTSITLTIKFNRATLFSFWWKCNSQIGYDHLSFKINNNDPAGGAEQISGAQDWQLKKHFLQAQEYIFKWEYSKNSATDYGTDDGHLTLVEERLDPCSIFANLVETCVSNSTYCILHVRLQDLSNHDCESYCHSYNTTCDAAWEDVANSCEGDTLSVSCTADTYGDQICRCNLLETPNPTTSPTTKQPTTAPTPHIPTPNPTPSPTESPTFPVPTLSPTPSPTPFPSPSPTPHQVTALEWIQSNSPVFISAVVFLFACVVLVTFGKCFRDKCKKANEENNEGKDPHRDDGMLLEVEEEEEEIPEYAPNELHIEDLTFYKV